MMINNNLFWLLICGHLIGDFYFQTQKVADGKKEDGNVLTIHVALYGLAVLMMLIPILNFKLFLMTFLFVVVSHFIVDTVKKSVVAKMDRNSFISRNVFICDQITHIAIITIFALIYANYNTIALNQIGLSLAWFYNQLGMSISLSELLRLVIVFLIICKPANILIKDINSKDKIMVEASNCSETTDEKLAENQDEKTIEPEYKNAGKLIGILERLLTVILVMLNQYAAVGLIFAAKSLTRYDKITKEPSFAEYYLVGTLLSLLIAIGAVLVVKPM